MIFYDCITPVTIFSTTARPQVWYCLNNKFVYNYCLFFISCKLFVFTSIRLILMSTSSKYKIRVVFSVVFTLQHPHFLSYFAHVLGSQGGCGEIGLPHLVWCKKQDFQVVVSRSVTWQDRLAPVGFPLWTLPSGLRAVCRPLQSLCPVVSQPAACSLLGVEGGSSVRGGSGWSFQMLH